jgi:hypothetical protein
MALSVSWSWIVGVIAALIVIASLAGSRRRRAGTLEPPEAQLDDSGTFPVLTPPEEDAEILVPPEDGVPAPVFAEIVSDALTDAPATAAPPDAAVVEDELDDALDDALDRVVK